MQALRQAARQTLCPLRKSATSAAAGFHCHPVCGMHLSSAVGRQQPIGWHLGSSSSSSCSMLRSSPTSRVWDASCSHDAASLAWRKWPAQQLACHTGRQASCLLSSQLDLANCSTLPQQRLQQVQHFQSFRRICRLQQLRCAASHASISSAASTSSSSSSSSSSPRLPAATDISSNANPYIKHCVKLRENSRYRQQQRRLLLVGQTLLSELAEEAGSSLDILVLFMRPGADLPASMTAQRIVTVSDSVMKKLTGLEEAAGVQVVAELALPQYVDLCAWITTPSSSSSSSSLVAPEAAAGPNQAAAEPQQQQQKLQRLLVLEGVQDPGNLGTLLRCAAAFGWDAVWLLPGCCDPFNDKALRASRGAALRWPLAAGSLQDLLQLGKQQGMLLLAAHPEDPHHQQRQQQQQAGSRASCASGAAPSTGSITASSSKQQQPVCLILGTEGAGLSDEVLAVATPLAVPMSGRMESLNVGVAGAILMFALSEGLEQLLWRLQQLGQMPGAAQCKE